MPHEGPLTPQTEAFYREVVTTLNAAEAPYLVGGAYALEHYTGIARATKDLDLFVRQEDLRAMFPLFQSIGCRTEIPFPHWLAKAHRDDDLIDLIYSSGNGIATVDGEWFRHATTGDLLGLPARFIPVEEMIWSKALIMERERFDGADVLHLIRARSAEMDWTRLLARFGDHHWPGLLAHLVLFGFVYPGARDLVPAKVMDELLGRLERQKSAPVTDPRVCRGTILSRAQYLVDIEEWGLQDARLGPETTMTASDLAIWTDCIAEEVRPRSSRLRS
jgi:hypothetical protein